ncbi:MAG: hypothetical protein ACFCVC_06985 [Acidimicrobiia bacterium]
MTRSPVLLTLVFGLVLAACSTPGSQISQGEGLNGTYVVNGIDPVGIEYGGTVIIEESDSGEITLQWLVTGAILEGTGRLLGDQLEVEWTTIEAPRGDASGTATYTLEDDGRLVGTRTIDGVDGEGTEEIFPQG